MTGRQVELCLGLATIEPQVLFVFADDLANRYTAGLVDKQVVMTCIAALRTGGDRFHFHDLGAEHDPKWADDG